MMYICTFCLYVEIVPIIICKKLAAMVYWGWCGRCIYFWQFTLLYTLQLYIFERITDSQEVAEIVKNTYVPFT